MHSFLLSTVLSLKRGMTSSLELVERGLRLPSVTGSSEVLSWPQRPRHCEGDRRERAQFKLDLSSTGIVDSPFLCVDMYSATTCQFFPYRATVSLRRESSTDDHGSDDSCIECKYFLATRLVFTPTGREMPLFPSSIARGVLSKSGIVPIGGQAFGRLRFRLWTDSPMVLSYSSATRSLRLCLNLTRPSSAVANLSFTPSFAENDCDGRLTC